MRKDEIIELSPDEYDLVEDEEEERQPRRKSEPPPLPPRKKKIDPRLN